MSCRDTSELLSAYVDDELAPDRTDTVAEHLAVCPVCAREYAAVLATSKALQERLVRYGAPDVLRARVQAALREEAATDYAAVRARAPAPPRPRPPIPWRAIAAAVVVAVASSALTLLATGRSAAGPTFLAQDVLASHIRSLMPDHLTDVRSNDTHNVKPWFNGRLDFSPAVPRLDDQGFPLLGGRLDYVHGRPVAVVAYGRRQHVINVFSWPAQSGGDSQPSEEARHGYTMMRWLHAGMEYWAVSDVNQRDLAQFADAFGRDGK